jgi:DNA-binding IclR family transcriptional regulator
VQSVERALVILRTLADAGEPLRLVDVQQRTGLQKSIAFRLLKTLADARFVEQEPATSRFHIGVGAFEVAQAYPRGGSLIRASRPHLQQLVEGSPHTAYLATLDGFDIVYLAVVEGTGPLRVHVSPGSRNPAHATAVGKALLAELDDAEVRDLARSFGLPALTPTTITGERKLLECIRDVRDRGYALNDAEAYPGIGSVAAVVRDGSARASAGITLSYATSLIADDELPAWIERTTAAAREISRALGGTGFGGGMAA